MKEFILRELVVNHTDKDMNLLVFEDFLSDEAMFVCAKLAEQSYKNDDIDLIHAVKVFGTKKVSKQGYKLIIATIYTDSEESELDFNDCYKWDVTKDNGLEYVQIKQLDPKLKYIEKVLTDKTLSASEKLMKIECITNMKLPNILIRYTDYSYFSVRKDYWCQ